MATFKFTATTLIDAETKEEAVEEFIKSSFDFAARAECEEVSDDSIQL